MRLKTPSFWYDTQSLESRIKASALSSLSAIYGLGHKAHQMLGSPQRAGIPVICLGNFVAGGSGKTPSALAVMSLVKSSGLAKNPCFLSRGYGGTTKGPTYVDLNNSTSHQTGDEPRLLARSSPTIISADRFKGAQFARENGHDLIIMDDGMQNTSLSIDISIAVVDGSKGFGNGLLIPAGPLRTPLHNGLKKTDIILIIGEDQYGVSSTLPPGMPVLHAKITATPPENPKTSYLAFCGIAHPDKFEQSLRDCRLNITTFKKFPDHYPYTAGDMNALAQESKEKGAGLITTAKDAVRITSNFDDQFDFDTLDIGLNFSENSVKILTQQISSMMHHE